MQVSKAVLERAKKIMLELNGKTLVSLKLEDDGVIKVENPINNKEFDAKVDYVYSEESPDFVPLKPIDTTKPPKVDIELAESQQYDVKKDLSAPKHTQIKTEVGEKDDVNDIKIWQDPGTGRSAISIGGVVHEVSDAVFQLFTRMVATQRSLVGDLESERFNNKKLKTAMTQ